MKYPGAKNADGVWQTIISNIPYHKRRLEWYAGTASISLRMIPANTLWLNDLNPAIVEYLRSSAPKGTRITCKPALSLLYKNVFTREDFIYLDPPYIDESRRSSKKLYKYEMLDRDSHIELLKRIREIDANVMISTKPSKLYDRMLKGWRKVEMKTIDRSGEPYTEVIYMNYPDGLILHQYDHIGKDYIQRQANKRMAANVKNKTKKLPPHLRQLFVKTVIENNADLAQHFLYVRTGKP